MKNLSQFKKYLANGGKIQLLSVYGKPVVPEISGIRKVEKMQTNNCKFEGGSWLEFPKFEMFKIIDDTAIIYDIVNGEKIQALTYKIIN